MLSDNSKQFVYIPAENLFFSITPKVLTKNITFHRTNGPVLTDSSPPPASTSTHRAFMIGITANFLEYKDVISYGSTRFRAPIEQLMDIRL